MSVNRTAAAAKEMAREAMGRKKRRFYGDPVFDGAILKDGEECCGSFHTLEAAQAMADLLNTVMAMPFDQIGATTKGANDGFGRERVAHLVAKALGQAIAPSESH